MFFSRIALASALLVSRALATDYTISVGGTPVALNGFDELTNTAELTMAFTLADGAAVETTGSIACAAYDITTGAPNQCNTGVALAGQIDVTPTRTVNALSVATNVNLETIGTSAGYSYVSGTQIGTLEFCVQCVTSDTTAGAIDYAEIMSTVTIDMNEAIPTFNVNVQEGALTTDAKNQGNPTYAVNAYQCNDDATHTTNSDTLGQGSFVGLCVNFALAGVNCLNYDALAINGVNFVTAGAIVNSAITTGNDGANPTIDDTCYISTQFPSSLIPADGSAATRAVTGTVVLEFEGTPRRQLRVDLATGQEVRGLEEGTANFEYDINVQANADPFATTSGAMSKAGAGLAGAAVALVLAAI